MKYVSFRRGAYRFHSTTRLNLSRSCFLAYTYSALDFQARSSSVWVLAAMVAVQCSTPSSLFPMRRPSFIPHLSGHCQTRRGSLSCSSSSTSSLSTRGIVSLEPLQLICVGAKALGLMLVAIVYSLTMLQAPSQQVQLSSQVQVQRTSMCQWGITLLWLLEFEEYNCFNILNVVVVCSGISCDNAHLMVGLAGKSVAQRTPIPSGIVHSAVCEMLSFKP